MLWAMRRDGEGPRAEGVSSRWGWQSPGCEWGWWLRLLGAPASFSGSVSTLRFLELPAGKKTPIPTTQEGSVFSIFPPTTLLASVPVSVHPPPAHLWGFPFILPGRGARWRGKESRDQQGWEAALSTRPRWAAPWASVDALGTVGGEPPWRGRPPQPGPHCLVGSHSRAHSPPSQTPWAPVLLGPLLAGGAVEVSKAAATAPPGAGRAEGRRKGQRLRAWGRSSVLQRKGKGLRERTACANVGCAEVDFCPQASGPARVPRKGGGELCLGEP